jgi:hypothetical protein
MRVTAGLEAQRRRQEVVPRERVAPPQPLSSLEQRRLGDRATPLSTSPGGQAEDMAEPDRWRHPESRSTKSEAGDALPQTGIDRPRIAVLQRSMQAEVAAFVAGQRHRPRHPSAAARTLGLEVERRRLLRKLRAIRSGLPTPLSLPPPCTSSTR